MVPTAGVSGQCLSLLDRAIAGHVLISASVPILSDTVHKVMISEAARIAGRDRVGLVGYLNKHPEIIARLVEYPRAMDQLTSIPMTLLPVDSELLRVATTLALKHRLLTSDATILVLMERHHLTHLVTNDDDFDSAPGLTVWKPR